MIELFEKSVSVRRLPINYTQQDHDVFAHELKKEIQPTHALSLINCHILIDSIFDGQSFYFSYTHFLRRVPVLSLLKRLGHLFKRPLKIDHAVWVVDDWSSGYYHWMCDALPRLLASEQVDKHLPVLLPAHYESISYIQQSLQLLGRDAIYYHSNVHLICHELLLMSHTAKSGNYNDQLIRSLSARFLVDLKAPGSGERRIYLSREKSERRKIINEKEVQAMMKDNGYEIHCFEEYPLLKQIEMMVSARSLVSLHGSGLTNQLFMPTGGSVLELRSQGDSHNNCYFSLASGLHHRYYYMWCMAQGEDTQCANVKVDIADLEKNLKLVLAC